MDWERWFARQDRAFPGRSNLTQVQSYPTMLDMVCAGEGISLGTLGIEDDLFASGRITRLGDIFSRAGFGYFLVYKDALLDDLSFAKLRAHLIGVEH